MSQHCGLGQDVGAVTALRVVVHVGSADAAGAHLHQDICGAKRWQGFGFDADVQGCMEDGRFGGRGEFGVGFRREDLAGHGVLRVAA
jgi:hypothetical protein